MRTFVVTFGALVLSASGSGFAQSQHPSELNVTKPMIEMASAPKDGQRISDTTEWGTCYTGQGQAYKCAKAIGDKARGSQSNGNELVPTAAFPYVHTRQMCRGRNGIKKPCRIYR